MNQFHKILLGISLGFGLLCLIFLWIDSLFDKSNIYVLAGVAIVACGVTFLLFLIALVGAAIKGDGNKNLP